MKSIITLLFTVFIFNFSFAQDNVGAKDTINFEEYDFGQIKYFENMLYGVEYSENYLIYKAPTIDVNFGNSQATYKHDKFGASLADNGIISADLGFTSIIKIQNNKNIFKYKYNGISISNSNKELRFDNTQSEKDFLTRIWRVATSHADGYGWSFGSNVNLALYHSSGLAWSNLNIRDNNLNDTASINAVGVFGKQIRFGKKFSGGAKLYITRNISLNAEYERTMIFPRYLFWKDVLSYIIEAPAQGVTSWFTGKVAKEAPIAAPIVHFVLKNALSYGFYELYKENMNWPSKTAAPLINDNFKVGIGFVF